MSDDPIYICQTAEPEHFKNGREWISKRAAEARQLGVTHFRCTVSEELSAILIEGWETRPEDQGGPRWAFVAEKEPQNE